MLASSSPPKVSRPRHGPFSRPTTLTPFSVSTLAMAAPEAPAPMMHPSARVGFVLFATIDLQIFLFLAFREPGQRAVAASEHFQHQSQRRPEEEIAEVGRVGLSQTGLIFWVDFGRGRQSGGVDRSAGTVPLGDPVFYMTPRALR